jgi:hypothetical protein
MASTKMRHSFHALNPKPTIVCQRPLRGSSSSELWLWCPCALSMLCFIWNAHFFESFKDSLFHWKEWTCVVRHLSQWHIGSSYGQLWFLPLIIDAELHESPFVARLPKHMQHHTTPHRVGQMDGTWMANTFSLYLCIIVNHNGLWLAMY